MESVSYIWVDEALDKQAGCFVVLSGTVSACHWQLIALEGLLFVLCSKFPRGPLSSDLVPANS